MQQVMLRIGGLLLAASLAAAANAAPADGWPHYGGGQHGMQYSSLKQINAQNVVRLAEAWRYRSGEMSGGYRRGFSFQATPILAEGRLYFPTGSAIVIALDPATGRELWRFDAQLDRSKNHSETANRGVSSWIDTQAEMGSLCRHRLYVGTLDARLIALDGATGRPCVAFADDGQLRLDEAVGAEEDDWINYLVTSPPAIVNDVVVIGSAIGDNRTVQSELGIVRGIDARSGDELWRWDPVPRSASDPAYAGWNSAEAAVNGSANAWAPLAADVERGIVYVPTGSASPDFYGGEREGDNLYANSLVAIDASSGERIWHRQLVHHDVWDYDLASQPTLVDLTVDGESVPAVLQGTKTGMIFTFDRVTGEPLFPIEERPVPQGGAAGEHLSPTQPFPAAPPPLASHAPVTEDEAFGLVWFDKRSCRRRISALRSEGIFTPPDVGGTLLRPGYAGGINWGGVAFDPSDQIAVAFVMDLAMEVALIPRDELRSVYESGEYDDFEFARQSGTPFGMRRNTFLSPIGMPCLRPPWGTLVAVDMRRGEIRWQVPLGTIQDAAPALVPNFEYGVPGAGGPIITAGGLIFIAAAMDDYLRAFRLADGAKLWEQRLPAGGQATPMSYQLDATGRQYVVIAAGGHSGMGTTRGDYVIAYALPAD